MSDIITQAFVPRDGRGPVLEVYFQEFAVVRHLDDVLGQVVVVGRGGGGGVLVAVRAGFGVQLPREEEEDVREDLDGDEGPSDGVDQSCGVVFPTAAVASIATTLPHGTCAVDDYTEGYGTRDGSYCSEQEIPDAISHREMLRGH